MSKRRTFFTSNRERAVAMNIKVPFETKSRIDDLKEALRQADDSLAFNVSKICGDALLSAVKRGESEVAKMRPLATAKASPSSEAGR